MANARPPGGQTAGGPQARIGIDLSLFREAVNVARESGRATSREISQAFRTVQNEQRVALEQARQTTAVLRAQQTQISASTRAESTIRITTARAEAQAQQQAARTAAAVRIEEERRITAQLRSELRTREAEQRASFRGGASGGVAAGSGGGLGQFAGAALGGIGGPLGGVLGGIAGGNPAIGVGLAVGAGARAAFDASQTAVAYDRQRVAALNLAGSQTRLNELLVSYDRATGSAIAQSTALAKVTQLMSVGFADNAQELDQFARAIRGISIAMGTTQDTVTQNLILELFSQRGMRLDQLGLQYDKVRQRADELQASDARLTQQQAYQNAVLEQAEQRYGALADSAVGQATGVERLNKSWADFSLTLGQASRGPINGAAHALATLIDTVRGGLEELSQTGQTSTVRGGLSVRTNTAGAQNILAGLTAQRERVLADIESGARPLAVLQADLAELDAKIKAVNISLGTLDVTARNASFGSRTSIGRVTPTRIGGFEPEQQAIIAERYTALSRIQRDADRAIVESASQFAQQRASTIANYEQQIAREAEDFGRQRANAERKLQMSILDVAQDSARQRVKWEADLQRNIASARADSAERVAQFEADRAERLGELRQESAERVETERLEMEERIGAQRVESTKRIAEIEADQRKEQERATRDHRRTLITAAAQLDAFAIAQEQRRFADEQQERQTANQEAVAKERERLTEFVAEQQAGQRKLIQQEATNLQKRIDEENKAHDKRLAQEARALEKSIAQQQEAHALRLAEQAENDRLRIEEMQRNFEEQKRQEDIERGIRLSRQAADHQAQLAEMDRAQGERIAQIREREAEAIAETNHAYDERLQAEGVFNAKLEAEQRRHQAQAERDYAEHIAKLDAIVKGQMQGPQPQNPLITPGQFPSLTTPAPVAPVGTGGGSSSVMIGPISPTIVLGDIGNHSLADIDAAIERGILRALNNVAGPYQQ